MRQDAEIIEKNTILQFCVGSSQFLHLRYIEKKDLRYLTEIKRSHFALLSLA